MKTSNENLSEYLQAISSQPRLEIVQAIGEGEACVCHLEAALGYRQAYISQHLMALRDAGAITARREGRFVFYRLADNKLLALIMMAKELLGMRETSYENRQSNAVVSCPCPKCSGEERVGDPAGIATVKNFISQSTSIH
jgi:DNA-binding transcriptional ArsR family regulator